jgi:hypothetical protein
VLVTAPSFHFDQARVADWRSSSLIAGPRAEFKGTRASLDASAIPDHAYSEGPTTASGVGAQSGR